MRAVRVWLTALGLISAAAVASPALACVPAPDAFERRFEYEEQQLREATLLYRGVIEDLRHDPFGETTMVIRRTETLEGRGAPDRLVIPWEYFANCARGNLHPAVDLEGEYADLPLVRNGLAVTLIGRPEHVEAPWDFIILVDGAPDSERVLRRYAELKQDQ